MPRILIVDDHEVVRRGLSEILLDEWRDVVVGLAADYDGLFEKLRAEEWDLVLLDVSLPRRSGLDALTDLKRLLPALPVLVLSASEEEQVGVKAVTAGAAGYLNKQCAADHLVLAIRTILGGGTYLSGTVLARLTQAGHDPLRAPAAPHERLSSRELQILKAIAEGQSVKGIAGELGLSDKTVATYLTRIREKTGLATHVEITRYAFRHGLTR